MASADPDADARLARSRHVVSHNLRDEHLNERNRLIAVMLMMSLLQTVQHEEVLGLTRVA